MASGKDFGSQQAPEAMKVWFDSQKKREGVKETPKPPEGRGPAVRPEATPEGPDMFGFRNQLESLARSIDISKRSTRESPDEEAAVAVKRFLEERNGKNDWSNVDYPAGMFKYLRDLKVKLADSGTRERLPRGDELRTLVERALDQFE